MRTHSGSALGLLVLIASPVVSRRTRWSRGLQRTATIYQAVKRVELQERMVTLRPAVLLLDKALLLSGGISGIAKLQQLSPATKIILLTGKPNEREALASLEAGCKGYCPVHMDPLLLKKAVRLVHKGEVWVGRNIVSRLIHTLTDLTERQREKSISFSDQSFNCLTERQREIVQQLGAGSSNKEIASRLRIAEKTVKAHLTSIFRKIGVSDRLQLALFANGINRQDT